MGRAGGTNWLRVIWRRLDHPTRQRIGALLARSALVSVAARAWCATEYLILLMVYRGRWRRARAASIIWFWSFGHQATDLHMLSLRFPRRDMVVLLSDYGDFNRHIVGAFNDIVDIVPLKHSPVMRALWRLRLVRVPELRFLKRRMLRLAARLLRCTIEIVESYSALGHPLGGGYVVEYIRLLGRNGVRPRVDAEVAAAFERRLAAARPDLEGRWPVALYLRKKAAGLSDPRDTSPGAYRRAVARIVEAGGFVFCGGDYDPRVVFPGERFVLGYADVPADRATADAYFLTRPRFLIGGHSGPITIAAAFDVPVLVTNCGFYYHSGFRENHTVLYKRLVEEGSGRELSAREVFTEPVVGYTTTSEFEAAGLVQVDNTEMEVLEATEEMIQRHVFGRELRTPEDAEREGRFRRIVHPESVVRHSPARPALCYLRTLELDTPDLCGTGKSR